MWPIEAQRFRLVRSATSRAPSSTFSKSRLESPWPWVTMQKRCAPAASAARACSRICSGSIIACIGVSASAYRDWAQKPQSSAQPPDLALTSEHMSVESPKRSWRTSQARSTRAPMSSWSVRAPSWSASSKLISGGIRRPPWVGRPKSRNEPGRLLPAEVLDDLGVALGSRAEDEQDEILLAAFEGAHHGRRDSDRVERPDLFDLVVELHA